MCLCVFSQDGENKCRGVYQVERDVEVIKCRQFEQNMNPFIFSSIDQSSLCIPNTEFYLIID